MPTSEEILRTIRRTLAHAADGYHAGMLTSLKTHKPYQAYELQEAEIRMDRMGWHYLAGEVSEATFHEACQQYITAVRAMIDG